MRVRNVVLCALFLLPAPYAPAAVINTFTDEATFVSQVLVADTISIGVGGAAPNITLNGAASSASAGPLTATASPGNLFGDGSVLSTETERTTLVLSFAAPVLAVGLFPYITDDEFNALMGQLEVVLTGSATQTLDVSASGPSFIGYESDLGFSSLRISILSSDPNSNATAFAALANLIYLGASPVSVPAPGLLSLLAPALFFAIRRAGRGAGRTSSCRRRLTSPSSR